MKISEIILQWYKKNNRDLPWRQTDEPYRIWLSEIILQQTRVEQGTPYYHKFTDKFPDLDSLAQATEDEVIKLWQGLGYYSRARNLHAAAKQVVTEFGGVFPDCYRDLLKLKGIGPYTAAAIASIAFNEPVAAVDGNVARVLSRIFAIEEPVNTGRGSGIIQEIARDILDSSDPGTHNQAMMEFGALHCVPANPDCQHCPLNEFCQAFNNGEVFRFPVKVKTKNKENRYFHYIILEQNGYTYIQKRTSEDIWKHMWEFPLLEKERLYTAAELIPEINNIIGKGYDFKIKDVSKPVRHILSHRTIHARFIRLHVEGERFISRDELYRINIVSVGDYALPRLIDRYLKQLPDWRL